MNVMQPLADFKQNLHGQPHSGLNGAVGARASAKAAAGPADEAGSGSGADSTTITANDFLQLLVAEMKNQDPTADQDPNAYIDQLVQVNSLQQLIAINQDLSGLNGGSSGGGGSGSQVRGHRGGELGSAVGTPAASVATALVPPPPQPERAPAHPVPGGPPGAVRRGGSGSAAVAERGQ